MRAIIWLILGSIVLPSGAATPEARELIARYQAEPVFWKQVDMTDEIVSVAKPADLAPLVPALTHADRHVRGNVGYLFAKMGDPRGFPTIVAILTDRSADRLIFADRLVDSAGNPTPTPTALARQISEDRYYAVHLLGELRDPRAVDVLVPLLDHDEVNYNVAWALGEIGDSRAVTPLITALRNKDALVRTTAIGALVNLKAKLALPAIESLVDDEAYPSAGEHITVGDAARKALDTLRKL
jgi:HEAT repeat protein